MKVILCSNPENLSAANPAVTVEAEYGDFEVKGQIGSLSHHGPRAGAKAPCLAENGVFAAPADAIIGVSHFDLDTLGGVLAVMGCKPENEAFWGLAAFVDVHGPHRLSEFGCKEDHKFLWAWWAWSTKNRLSPERDGSVSDITQRVMEAADVLRLILSEEPTLLSAGDEFRMQEENLNKESFIELSDKVAVRVSTKFVNALYHTPAGEVADAVVSLNPLTGAIVVSFSNSQGNAREIVQSLWGEKAGGHIGIAGSPRGEQMKLDDLVRARDAVRATLK